MKKSLVHLGKINWLVARITAVFILFYFIFLIKIWLVDAPSNQQAWSSLLLSPLMRVSFVLALLSILLHAWIGIWTVLTDYVKAKSLQVFLHGIFFLVLFSCFIWGVLIIGA